jgi:hypothetical protein
VVIEFHGGRCDCCSVSSPVPGGCPVLCSVPRRWAGGGTSGDVHGCRRRSARGTGRGGWGAWVAAGGGTMPRTVAGGVGRRRGRTASWSGAAIGRSTSKEDAT